MDIKDFKEAAYEEVVKEFNDALEELNEKKRLLEIDKYKIEIRNDLNLSLGRNNQEQLDKERLDIHNKIQDVNKEIRTQEILIDKLEDIKRYYVKSKSL